MSAEDKVREYRKQTAYLIGGKHKVAADAAIAELQAEVALRDRMLRDIIERIALTPERWSGWTTKEVLADLRERAGEKE